MADSENRDDDIDAPASAALHAAEPRDAILSVKTYSGPNPFLSTTPITRPYELVKVILMTVCLIPVIRSIVITLLVVLIWAFAAIGTACHDTSKPFSLPRRILLYPIRPLFRAIAFTAGFYWIRMSDKRSKSKPKPTIIVCNHISMHDAWWLIWRTGASGVAKADLFNVPLMGTILKALQWIPVERATAEGRRRALDAIKARANDDRFPPLLVFPEGTTSIGSVVTTFKAGAFANGVPVQPVAIRYSSCHCDLFFGDGNMLFWMWWSLCQVANFATYQFLPEYYPSEKEKANAKLFGSNVRDVIADALHAEKTAHSFSDVRLLAAMMRERGVVNTSEFVISDVTTQFGFKYKEILALIKRFEELSRHGHVTYDEFCERLQFRKADDGETRKRMFLSWRLFQIFDTTRSGVIGFTDFLAIMALFTPSGSLVDNVRVLFTSIDHDDDGTVSREDFERMISSTVPESTAKEAGDYKVDTPAPPTEMERKQQLEEETASLALQQDAQIPAIDAASLAAKRIGAPPGTPSPRLMKQMSSVTIFDQLQNAELDFNLNELLDALFNARDVDGDGSGKLSFDKLNERCRQYEFEIRTLMKVLFWTKIGGMD